MDSEGKMISKIKRLLLVVGLCHTVFCACYCAGEKVTTEDAGDKSADQELLDMAKMVKPRLEEILQRKFDKDVTVKVIGREEVKKIFIEELDKEIKPEEIKAVSDAFVLFGIFSEGIDLRKTVLDLFSSQAQGFYVPDRKALFLIHGVPMQEMVAAHELNHAMQDQMFGLRELQKAREKNDDRAAALTSIIEGEAVFSMSFYMRKYVSTADMLLETARATSEQKAQAEILARTPLYLRESMMFPYITGNRFVMQKWMKTRNWNSVRSLFKDIPESTEQIIHPEKFFGSRDRPTELQMSGLIEGPLKGWTLRCENTHGEYGTELLLRSLGVDIRMAKYGAAGWDGDHYIYLEKGEGADMHKALVWISSWDSENDSRDFANIYSGAIGKHFNVESTKPSPGKVVWTLNNKRDILLARWGQEILLLDGFSAGETKALRGYFSELKKSGKLFKADNRADGKVGGGKVEAREPAAVD